MSNKKDESQKNQITEQIEQRKQEQARVARKKRIMDHRKAATEEFKSQNEVIEEQNKHYQLVIDNERLFKEYQEVMEVREERERAREEAQKKESNEKNKEVSKDTETVSDEKTEEG